MSATYHVSPLVVSFTKDGSTRIVSLDDSDTTLVILHGPSAHVLKILKEPKTLEAVKAEIERIENRTFAQEEVMKLMDFLEEKKDISKN